MFFASSSPLKRCGLSHFCWFWHFCYRFPTNCNGVFVIFCVFDRPQKSLSFDRAGGKSSTRFNDSRFDFMTLLRECEKPYRFQCLRNLALLGFKLKWLQTLRVYRQFSVDRPLTVSLDYCLAPSWMHTCSRIGPTSENRRSSTCASVFAAPFPRCIRVRAIDQKWNCSRWLLII